MFRTALISLDHSAAECALLDCLASPVVNAPVRPCPGRQEY